MNGVKRLNALLENNDPKKLSIKEMRAIAQSPELLARSEENWYGKKVSRKFSIYYTKFFILFNITPNQVTWLMFFSGILGAFLFAFPSLITAIIAFFVFQSWLILDCSDGEVARLTGKKSLYGPYIDRLNHIVTDLFLLFSLGFKVFYITGDTLYLFLGALLSILNIFSRLLFNVINNIIVEYKVYKTFESDQSNATIATGEKKKKFFPKLLDLLEKIQLRRIFTATIEISVIFLISAIVYHFFPITWIFIGLLFFYLLGNLANTFARFFYIHVNYNKIITKNLT